MQRLYQYAGVNPISGFYQYIDEKGDLTETPNTRKDKSVIIDLASTFYGGIENTFQYNGFELSLLFQFVKQKGLSYLFGSYPPGSGPGVSFGVSNIGNQPLQVRIDGRKTVILKLFKNTARLTINSKRYLDVSQSDKSFMDASYVRLRNLSLSWQFPLKWTQKLKLNSSKLYMHGQNLLTITNYLGLDPETRSSITLPPIRMITFGIRVTI